MAKTKKKTSVPKKKTHAKKAHAKKASLVKVVRKKTAKSTKKSSSVKRTSAMKAAVQEDGAVSMVGKIVPSMIRMSTSGENLSLSDFKGRRIVLYFYPKDNTPGCTLEGYDFKRLEQDFQRLNTVILGVSKDSLKSHASFKVKCGFPFELVVDEDEAMCRAFDVIQMKNLYGRKYLGIERSTFVIGEDGRVLHEWRKVKVNGHAEEVLDYVRTL